MTDPTQAVNSQSRNTIDKTNQEIRGESRASSQGPTIGSTGRQVEPTKNQARPTKEVLAQQLAELDKQEAQAQSGSTPVESNQFSTQEIQIGDAPKSWEFDKQMDFKGIPYYDKYEGGAASDFYNSMMNAGVVNTAQGIANLIPTIASATTDAEWAKGWMDNVNDWADRSDGYVSQVGNKSFFDTWDIRSLAAGAGQGIGSMIPMIAASALTGGIGGAAGLFAGTGLRAGAAAASAAYGSAAAVSASALNMMPGIIEEGLANGLTHQQASSLSLAIAPMIGMMEKIGLDEVMKAGVSAASGKVGKSVLAEAFKTMSRKGMSAKNFQGSVKVALGEITANYRKQISDELIKKGVAKGSLAYNKAMAGATAKGLGKEAVLRGKDVVATTVKGAIPEAATESIQSLAETAAKQIYDLQFADKDATVGKGKFGADVMSKEAWTQALEEGFYGGLIGGSFSMASRGMTGMRTETINGALDAANKRGRLDTEVDRMLGIIDKLPNDPKDKQDLRDIVTTSQTAVKQMPSELTNSYARHQMFTLQHLARTLQGDIDETDVKNALPGMEDIATAKVDQLTRRLAETKRAIKDIYSTSQEVDLDGNINEKYKEGGNTVNLDDYFITPITAAQKAKQDQQVSPAMMKAEDKAKRDQAKTEFEQSKAGHFTMGEQARKINDFAQRISEGQDLSSAEDQEFYVNNKEAIEGRLKEFTQVPALSTEENNTTTAVTKSINDVVDTAQDEDLAYMSETAEAEHKTLYGEESASQLNNIITDLSEDEDLYEQGGDKLFQIKKDVSPEQKTKLIDKLVTARRAVLDLIEKATSDEAKEQLAHFDKALRKGIQEAKSLEATEAKSIDGQKLLETQKQIGNEQTKSETTATPVATEQKTATETEGSPRQIEGTQPVQEKIGAPTPSSETALKSGEQEGKVSPIDTAERPFKSLRDDDLQKKKAKLEDEVNVKGSAIETDRLIQLAAVNKEIETRKTPVTEPVSEPAVEPVSEPAKEETEGLVSDEEFEAMMAEAEKKYFKKGESSKYAKEGRKKLIKENRLEFDIILDKIRQIFPDVDIQLLEKVFAENGIEALGRVFENRIELSEDKATQDILFHELAHKFAPILSGARIWKRGIDMIKNSPLMDEAKKLYPDLTEDEQAEEALVMLIGEKSSDMIEARVGKEMWPKIKAWLKQFWNRLKYALNKANANDMAEIMAWDIAMRQKPVSGTGLSIGGEKLAKFKGATTDTSMNAIRIAAIKAKLFLNQNPQLVQDGRSKAVFNKFLEAVHNDMDTGKEFGNWNTFYKDYIDFMSKKVIDVDSEFSTELIDGEQGSTTSPDTDADLQGKVDSFINGGEKIDGNVRFIIESLVDSLGNQIPTDRIYGILVHVASLNTEPAYFLRTLKEFANKSGISSIDKNVASQLAQILDVLPDSIVKPIQAQLSSIVSVPHLRTHISKSNGVFNNFSNRKLNVSTIKNVIVERVQSAYLRSRESEKTDSERKDNIKKAVANIIKIRESIHANNVQPAHLRKLNKKISDTLKILEELTSLPVKLDWFPEGTSKSVIGNKKVQIKNLNQFIDAIVKSEAELDKSFAVGVEKRAIHKAMAENILEESKSILNKNAEQIAKQIDSSYGERSVFKNVMGNQQMGYKVGGFFHKLFSNKKLIDKDYSLNTGLTSIGTAVLGEYRKNFVDNIKKGIPNVAHSDGIFNATNNQKVMFNKMNTTDRLNYYLSTLFNTLSTESEIVKRADGTESIVVRKNMMNSIGTVSNRNFQAFFNIPLLTTNQAQKAIDSILAMNEDRKNGIGKNPIAEGVLPTQASIDESIKSAEDFLNNMYNTRPDTFIAMMGKFHDKTQNDLWNEMIDDKSFNYTPEFLSSIPASETQGMSIIKRAYALELQDMIGDVAEQMMTNEALGRYISRTMLIGDMGDMKGTKDILSRFDKTTSPVTNYDLRDNPKDEQPETVVIILEDVYTQRSQEARRKAIESGVDEKDAPELVSASDSWGYFSDYLGEKIAQQGGDLIKYGQVHKPLINDVSDTGEFTMVKFASESFQEHNTDEDIIKNNLKKDGVTPNTSGRIGVALRKLQAANPGVPIVISYVSAVKSNKEVFKKDGKLMGVEDFISAAEKGDLSAIPHTKKRYNNFGVQFNINKKVGQGESDVILASQLINVITAGLPDTVDTDTFKETLSEITDRKVKKISKELQDKKDSLTKALDAAGGGVTPFVKNMLESLLEGKTSEEVNALKIDQYDLGSVLQNWVAAQFTKGIRHKMDGGILLQTTDIDGDLEYHTVGEVEGKYRVTKAEVIVPEGFAPIGSTVIQVRVPLTNKINIVVAKVVGHSAKGSNKVVMPDGWIDASNSDNDGDSMFTMTEPSDDLDNKLFWEMEKLLTDGSLLVDENGNNHNKGYNETLDVTELKDAVYDAEVLLGNYANRKEAKEAIENAELKLNSVLDEAEAADKLKESGDMIGILAIGAKVVNALSSNGVKLNTNNMVKLPPMAQPDGREKGGRYIFTLERMSQIAATLQMALDDVKQIFLHNSGINAQNSNSVVLLLGLGYDLPSVIAFMKNPAVSMYNKKLGSNRNIFDGKNPLSKDEITESVKIEMSGTMSPEDVENNMMMLKAYKEIDSQAEIVSLVASVTQMDKGVPKDSVALMDLKGKIEKLAENKSNTNLGTLLTDPIYLSRQRAVSAYEDVLSSWFSAITKNKEGHQLMTDTLSSFDTKNGFNNKAKSRVAQKAWSKTIARKMSKYRYTPEVLARNTEALIEKIASMKIDPNVKSSGWLSLIGFKTIGQGVDSENVRLIPTYRRTFAELDETESADFNDAWLEEQWNALDAETREQILEYAIQVEGLVNEGQNISHLLPMKVYKRFTDVASSIEEKDIITPEFMDNIVREGHEDIALPRNDWKGTENNITLQADKPELKYFKQVVDGETYIYRVDSQEDSGKRTSDGKKVLNLKATLLVAPSDVFKLADKSAVQYKLDDSSKPEAEDINPHEETTTEAQNIEAAIAEEISEIATDEMLNGDEGVDESDQQWQKVSTGDKTEDAKKVNRRILRRLSQKFNIPYKIINNPDAKFKGFYDKATNTVVINEAYATGDTAVHEFAHPFITSIKNRNPELYVNLAVKVETTEEGKAVLERVKKLYPELDEEGQLEEAMVQLLGELAQDKIKDLTLKETLMNLWNQIVSTVKQLFGMKADIIQEKMNLNTTLSELADMILDTKGSIDLDVQMDDQFRRAMDFMSRSAERIQKLFNPAIEVVMAKDVMNDKHKEVHSKMTDAGFLANNNFIIKLKNNALDASKDVLSFRIPLTKTSTWMKEVKSMYPQAEIISVSNSPIKGFKMYEVSIGDEMTMFMYKPISGKSYSNSSIAGANIQFQHSPAATRSYQKLNTDSNLFGGHAFDLDEYDVTNVAPEFSDDQRIALIKGFWEAETKGVDFDKILDKDAKDAELLKHLQNAVRAAQDQAVSSYEQIVRKGRLTGDLKDVVKLNEIKNSIEKNPEHRNLWRTYLSTGNIPTAADQDFYNAVYSFEKMLVMTQHLKNNHDYLMSNGKKINAQQVADGVIKKYSETSENRKEFFNQFPLIGKLYNLFSKGASSIKDFTLNMFTPEVMANVVNGQDKTFLHQLVSDSMLEGDEKDAQFKEEVMKKFREGLTPEQVKSMSSFSDWSGIGGDPLKAKTMTIKGIGDVPLSKALSLYLALRQPDIRIKANEKGGSTYNVFVFNEKTQKEVKGTIDGDLFLKSFENIMTKNPEISSLVSAIDKTMAEVHSRVSPTVKSEMGVELDKLTNYFPTKYGSRSTIGGKGEKARIEDFAGIKDRSVDRGKGIRLDDAFFTMDGYINQASRYNAYVSPINNLRKLIYSMEKSEGYDVDSHGGAVAYIYDMIDHIQDYRQLSSIADGTWEKAVRKSMNNFTLAVLGWNPAVALKQVVSIISAAPELGYEVMKSSNGRSTATRIIKDSYAASKLKKGRIGQLNLQDDTLVEIMDLSPLMRQRFSGYIDRDQGEYRSSGMNPYNNEGKKSKFFGKEMDLNATMEMIKIHDAAAIAWIYEHIKEANPGLNKAQLKKKFEQTVMRTQPTYNISSRTNLGRSNDPLMRLFTMFSSQRSKNMNMMANAIVNYATNPDERAMANLKLTLLSIGVLSSVGIAVIDKAKYALMGGGDDDESIVDTAIDVGAMSMLNTLGNIYFVGQFAQMVDANIRNKPFGKTIEHPVFQTASIAAKGVADLSKGDVFKAADGAIQTTMRMVGAPLFPYTNIVKKGVKAIGSE